MTAGFAEALNDLGFQRQYAAGQYLFHQGDRSIAVYLLKSGRVKVLAVGDDGRSSILALRGPGELIGELGAIDGHRRSAAAVATEPTDAVVVPSEQFAEVLRTTPGVALQVLVTVSGRLRDADRQRVEFGGGSLASRVVNRLTALAHEHGTSVADGVRIDVTQHDLAAFVGASREAVARCLSSLRARGALTTGRAYVVIVDEDLLHLPE